MVSHQFSLSKKSSESWAFFRKYGIINAKRLLYLAHTFLIGERMCIFDQYTIAFPLWYIVIL